MITFNHIKSNYQHPYYLFLSRSLYLYVLHEDKKSSPPLIMIMNILSTPSLNEPWARNCYRWMDYLLNNWQKYDFSVSVTILLRLLTLSKVQMNGLLTEQVNNWQKYDFQCFCSHATETFNILKSPGEWTFTYRAAHLKLRTSLPQILSLHPAFVECNIIVKSTWGRSPSGLCYYEKDPSAISSSVQHCQCPKNLKSNQTCLRKVIWKTCLLIKLVH